MGIRKAAKKTYRYFMLQKNKSYALKVIKRYKARVAKYGQAHAERVKKSVKKRDRQSKTFLTAIKNLEAKVRKYNADLKKL